MSTDQVSAAERPGLLTDWLHRLLPRARLRPLRRQRVRRPRRHRARRRHRADAARSEPPPRHALGLAGATVEVGYLKIVAPWVGCAGGRAEGREAWVTPDQWSIYDTTDSYAVANPVRVEHLIVMLPERPAGRTRPRPRCADGARLGGSGGVARIALETMRNAYRELPGMSETGARGVGDAITQLCTWPCSISPASAPPSPARGAARAHQTACRRAGRRPGAQRRQHRAGAQLQPPPALQRLRRRADGVAGYILRRRLEGCRRCLDDRAGTARSPRIAFGDFGFSNMAHFSRVFRAPGAAAERLPAQARWLNAVSC